MKIARIVAPALITAAATLIPLKLANAACEIVETPRGPQLRCSLSELSQGRDDLKISKNPNPSRLPLPNLVVKDIDDTKLGNSVEVGIEVENRGTLSAAQFVVSVDSDVKDPLNNGNRMNGPAFPLINVLALPVGANFTAIAGTVTLPNNSQDWDVCTDVTVDYSFPPTASGNVLESNENDNEDMKCCRVYYDNTAPNDPGPC